MNHSPWRKFAVGILSVAILNMGMAGAASAAVVDTAELIATDRAADMSVVRSQLDRAEVRAHMEEMGMDAAAVDRRIASLNDRELHRLAVDMQNAPAGGDVVWIVGAVFIVLIILELTGVIDIFKKT
ncbi:MAG TPA: PA2779 family protein [Steroidobacteraceae bacterium]|nr:PA2779 family protein [Steroidobacteraceae bacterium]